MPGEQLSLVFESFGLVGEVRTDDEELFGWVPVILPPGWRHANGEKPGVRFEMLRSGPILVDGTPCVDAEGDPAESLVLLRDAVRHHLALHAPHHTFVHAGVVGVEGGAIVLPGSTRCGKTTLVEELVRRGATYYSDEYAPVDGAGLVHPYAQPLSVRPAPERRGRPVPVPGESGREPLPARLVVLTRFEERGGWDPEERTPGEGAIAVLENTVPVRARPGTALAAAAALVRGAKVLAGPRGEARTAATDLLRRMRDDAQGLC